MVGLEYTRTHDPFELSRSHAPVETQRRHDVDVLHAVLGQLGEHLLYDPLPYVRRLHRWQRDGYVVEGDGDLHPRPDLGGQRVATQGVLEGCLDLLVNVGNSRQGWRGIDHAGAQRQPLVAKGFAAMKRVSSLPVLHIGDQLLLVDVDMVGRCLGHIRSYASRGS